MRPLLRSGRSSIALVLGSASLGLVILGSCDRAFRSGGSTGGSSAGSFTPTLTFDDGSTEATVTEGGAAVLKIGVPSTGHERLVTSQALEVDPSRVIIALDQDLGDPADGGHAAGTNLSPLLAELGRLAVVDEPFEPLVILATIDTVDPFTLPFGRTNCTVTLLDDIDRESAKLSVGLTVAAKERPTASLLLEIPPAGTIPTGLPLPLDVDGVPVAGEKLPFVLTVRCIPNPSTQARFDLLVVDGSADPARLIVVADRDLGDPANGGFAAGENLAPIFAGDLDVLIDEQTGELIVGALFPLGAAFSPLLGDTMFTATIVDDAGVDSFPSSTLLRIESVVALSALVQPIYNARCATSACHDSTSPSAGLDLSAGNSWDSTVNVRSTQTPDDSCAPDMIEPYAISASYLWHKVKDTHIGGCVKGSGLRMPRSGPPLSSTQIERLEKWIRQGAHDN